MTASRPVKSLPNIGPRTAAWLREAGIATEADLQALGSVAAYRRLKALHPHIVSLNALYGLEAALIGCRWSDLTGEMKAALRAELDAEL